MRDHLTTVMLSLSRETGWGRGRREEGGERRVLEMRLTALKMLCRCCITRPAI